MLSASSALAVLLALACGAAIAAAPERKRSNRLKRELLIETGPSEVDAEDAELLGHSVSYAALVERGTEYFHEVQHKRFGGNVLGFVTPWNRQGYAVAARFNAKFTHISPVWYQLKKSDGVLTLQGGHEVNRTWIAELQTPAVEGAAVPKLVPRVILELAPQDMVELVSYPETAVQLLLEECQAQHYDGMVLEAWVQWVAINGLNNDSFRAAAFEFIRLLSKALHSSTPPKELILVVPPAIPSHFRAPFFNTTDYLELEQVVDGFSIMTYDFSDGVNPGPNSPTHWVRSNVDALLAAEGAAPLHAIRHQDPSKLLMGTNFYGYKYRSDSQGQATAVVAAEFLQLLHKYAPTLRWDAAHEEHYIAFKDGAKRHKLYYPTPASLAARLQMASQLGVGLSIWELGQGMDRFMHLL